MKRWTVLGISICFLLSILALTACDSDGSASSDPSGGGGGFLGAACINNDGCDSDICHTVGGSSFCTRECSSDETCIEAFNDGDACCDTVNHVCLTSEFCGGGDGPDEHECEVEGDYRCSQKDIQKCVNGEWGFYRSCEDESKTCYYGCADDDDPPCEDVYCVDSLPDGDVSCTIGAKQCDSTNTAVERCNSDGNGWVTHLECISPDVCEDATCVSPRGDECVVADGCPAALQYCLPVRYGDTEGYCAVYCDQPGIHCPRGWQCDHGECEVIPDYCQSDSQCEMDQFCNRRVNPDGTLSDDGQCKRYCFKPGENCGDNEICIDDTSDINYGRCVPLDPSCRDCSNDMECGGGAYCEIISGQMVGCCRDMCGTSNPCPAGLSCQTDGRCSVGGTCDCGGQCPTGYICDPTYCQCVLNCPQCPQGMLCDASSAPNCYEGPCTNPAVCGLLLPPCCFGYNCSAVIYGVLGYCI